MSATLVAITGPDGSGKSTACAGAAVILEEKLGAGTVAVASIWDSMIATGAFKKDDIVTYLATLHAAARTLFLFHAMRQAVELARAKSPRLILADSYFYKYAATELAYGTSADVVRAASAAFERPALTICLDVPPGAAGARKKGETSHYESGGRGEFERFQNSMRTHWSALEREHGPWVHLDAGERPEAVAVALAARILEAVVAT